MKLLENEREAWSYSLAIHVFTASSTARVKSPFLPPNFSTVLNLSCFSSSSESSTHIRPIFNRLFCPIFSARFDVSDVLPISELPYAKFHVCFSFHFFIHLQFAYPHSILYAYTLIRVLVYYIKPLSDKYT